MVTACRSGVNFLSLILQIFFTNFRQWFGCLKAEQHNPVQCIENLLIRCWQIGAFRPLSRESGRGFSIYGMINWSWTIFKFIRTLTIKKSVPEISQISRFLTFRADCTRLGKHSIFLKRQNGWSSFFTIT